MGMVIIADTSKYIQIITTFESKADAESMASKILAEKLVACAHVSEINSRYNFEGKYCEHNEWELTMITSRKRIKKCAAFIKANHPYKVPQIIAIPVAFVSKEYAIWIDESLK